MSQSDAQATTIVDDVADVDSTVNADECFSDVDTVFLTYDVRREALVTPDTGHVTFVKNHRAPLRLGARIALLVVGAMLLGTSLFGMGTILGVSIAR